MGSVWPWRPAQPLWATRSRVRLSWGSVQLSMPEITPDTVRSTSVTPVSAASVRPRSQIKMLNGGSTLVMDSIGPAFSAFIPLLGIVFSVCLHRYAAKDQKLMTPSILHNLCLWCLTEDLPPRGSEVSDHGI